MASINPPSVNYANTIYKWLAWRTVATLKWDWFTLYFIIGNGKSNVFHLERANWFYMYLSSSPKLSLSVRKLGNIWCINLWVKLNWPVNTNEMHMLIMFLMTNPCQGYGYLIFRWASRSVMLLMSIWSKMCKSDKKICLAGFGFTWHWCQNIVSDEHWLLSINVLYILQWESKNNKSVF